MAEDNFFHTVSKIFIDLTKSGVMGFLVIVAAVLVLGVTLLGIERVLGLVASAADIIKNLALSFLS